MNNRITELFGIRWPIIQAGMVWVSGWRLAAAVSEQGGLGLIGAGSMKPDLLAEHIHKAKQATDKPVGVNVPLLYHGVEDQLQAIVDGGIKIVFTSAGNPAAYTPWLKERGLTVVHVVSSKKFALKAQAAGVDALVAEGFEAGGHNGREETTSLVLWPLVAGAVDVPVIAAGGVANGAAIEAAFALGAEGVQIGSRFAMTQESSAHQAYKEAVAASQEGDTVLTLKQLAPVRLIKNDFYTQVQALDAKGATKEDYLALLGSGRARMGIFDGLLDEGEIEVGQVAALLEDVPSVAELFARLLGEWRQASTASHQRHQAYW